jgi:hypothetical protein
MNNRATHLGLCQVCGARHKAGRHDKRLALHGYTVQFGSFNGSCRGSGELPFELSCDLVKWSIASAKEQVEKLSHKVAALEAGAGELVYPFEERIGRTRLQMWRACRVEKIERGVKLVSLVGAREQNLSSIHTIERGEQYVREVALRHYKSETEQLERYAKSQEERLVGWCVRELSPISVLEDERVEARQSANAAKQEREAANAERKRKSRIRENWSDLAWALWSLANVSNATENQKEHWGATRDRLIPALAQATEQSMEEVLALAQQKSRRLR